ncbi:MAG TPA: Wzz/FepE/Etk N-terminal domain-containing protein [Rhizomicrobium sp.]|nr:Wzz/FepE/Etk N-terminal domain-containing protein [Rhizomicrobium sp.]
MTLPIEAPKLIPLETPAPPRGEDSVRVSHILSVLWRRRAVFLSVFFLIAALGFVILKSLTPAYHATVVLVLSARQDGVVDMQQPYMNTQPSDPVVRSEIEALRSRTLVDRVIVRANLMQDPEFNRYLQPLRSNAFVCLPARILPGFLQVKLSCRKPDAGRLNAEQLQYGVASRVLKAFAVIPDPKTYAVKLDVTSTDPKKASRLANLWANEYMQMQIDEKVAEADRAMISLKPRLQQLGKEVARADTAVEDYKDAKHILNLSGSQDESNTLVLQEVQSLGLELASARTARTKLEAAQQEVRRLARDSSQTLSSPAVAAAPLVEGLRAQEAAAAAQLASLQGTYGERHPLVASAKKQLEELRLRLGQEVGRAVQQFDVQVRQSQINERQLQTRIDQLAAARAGENKTLPQLRQLSSAQTAAKAVYDAFVQGVYRAAAQNGVPTARGRVVQYASTPDWPSFPNTSMSMAVISLAALMIAMGLVYALEAMDHSFHGSGDLEEATGLNVLGMTLDARTRSSLVFNRSALRRPSVPVSSLMITQPSSAVSESLRLTRAAITTSRADRLSKVVMITSAAPGEGKTTFALMLGRQSAFTGKRTIVVEAEMRRPKFSRDLQSMPSKGLADLLMGRATLEEVIGLDVASGMHFIPAGEPDHGAVEMLGSARMATLLHTLSTQYDLVLLDTPPASIVADALHLGGMVDSAILLVKWATTPRHLVLDAIKKLRAAKAPLIGTVMSQVDARKYKYYGQGALPYEYARSYYVGA